LVIKMIKPFFNLKLRQKYNLGTTDFYP